MASKSKLQKYIEKEEKDIEYQEQALEIRKGNLKAMKDVENGEKGTDG